MRKTIILICLTAVFAACGADYYDRVISNNTASTTVSYVYDGKSAALGPGESKTYSVTLAVHAPSSINYTPTPSHPKSVMMESVNDGWDYRFVNVPPIDLDVTNTLSSSITISSEYINNSGTSITIAGNSSHTTAKIYTATPVFTVTPTGKVEYNIGTDGKLYVTIR